MGENDISAATPVSTTTAIAIPVEKPVVKAPAKGEKKKEKKPEPKVLPPPHVTGRLQSVDVSVSGVEFAVKAKKGKSELFSLKGFDPAFIPAASALLVSALAMEAKVRVVFVKSADGSRTVSTLRVLD